MKKILLLILPLIFTSCWFVDEGPAEFPAGDVIGYSPVYMESISEEITFSEVQPLINPGKIYRSGNILLVNERFMGVHIINNSNPSSPQIEGFLAIAGNVDIAVKGSFLIADHLGDLVTIDISDLKNPVVIDRVENLYDRSGSLPPAEGRYFECPDPKRSHLIRDWVLLPLNDPECYR